MKNKFSKTKFAILFYSGFAIWGMGFLFLPERIFWDSFQGNVYNEIFPLMGFMYVSPGFFAIIAVAMSIIFMIKGGDQKDDQIIHLMLWSFYLAITIALVCLTFYRREFLFSTMCGVTAMILYTVFVIFKNIETNQKHHP